VWLRRLADFAIHNGEACLSGIVKRILVARMIPVLAVAILVVPTAAFDVEACASMDHGAYHQQVFVSGKRHDLLFPPKRTGYGRSRKKTTPASLRGIAGASVCVDVTIY
jgi:hypothetical protein